MLRSARLRAGMQETLLGGTECSKHPDSPLTYTIHNEEERHVLFLALFHVLFLVLFHVLFLVLFHVLFLAGKS